MPVVKQRHQHDPADGVAKGGGHQEPTQILRPTLLAGEDAYEKLRRARDAVREACGRDQKSQREDEEDLGDGVLRGRHKPSDHSDQPPAEDGLQEHGSEAVLRLVGDLFEEDPQGSGFEDVPVDDHGRKQRGAEEVGDKNHNPNLSMFGTVLGSVNATVTGITVFSV